MKQSKRALKKFKVRQKANQPAAAGISTITEVEPKGMPGGRCNITACQKENSAVFLNLGMIGGRDISKGGCYYCYSCVKSIHEANCRFSKIDGMTLFPTLQLMEGIREELLKDRTVSMATRLYQADNFDNYRHIDQNPWGSCYHSDRDDYIKSKLSEAMACTDEEALAILHDLRSISSAVTLLDIEVTKSILGSSSEYLADIIEYMYAGK